MTTTGNEVAAEEFTPSNTALVIGGGVAGMQAALDLANQGIHVLLVESKPTIGGVMAMLDKTFPTLDCSACILTPRLSEVSRHPNIELLTYTEIRGISGEAGNFRVEATRKARKVHEDKCNGCGECVIHCPIEVQNDFDQGLALRKAIYISFPQSTPMVYTIDSENCIKCGLCVKFCEKGAIDLDMQEEAVTLSVGAIIIATGYQLYDVSEVPRLGYGRYRNVINALEYERIINASGPTMGNLMRLSDGKVPSSIGFVQCVGARDVQKGSASCSRICCMYGMKNAVMAKELAPEDVEDVSVYYADIRAFGKGFEEFYEMAKTRFGIRFIRGRVADVEENPENNNLIIQVEDTATGRLLEVEHEMLVLCPGILPPKSLRELANNLNMDLGSDGFVQVSNPILTPVDTPLPGIFVCGCAEGPKDIPDSVAAGSAAAMRASIALYNEGGNP